MDPVLFTALGVAGAAASLNKVSGDVQTGAVNATLPFPLVTQVMDAFGNPVAGTVVQFSADPGSGGTNPSQVPSQVDGIASAFWALGPTEGAQVLTASFPGADPVTFSAPAVAGGGGGGPGFDIVYDYVSPPALGVQQAFENAAARWSTVITGDLSPIPFNIPANSSCQNPNPVSLTFDDVYIFVVIEAIDGPGMVLGSAGPCFLRTPSFLPFAGVIRLDVDDVNNLLAQGRLEDVILHEVGHVLGIGTLWGLFGFLQDPSSEGASPPPDTHFTGPNSLTAFDAVGGAGYLGGAKVPVENTQGGAGTLNSHWRESVLEHELMTGFLSPGGNPLSQVTAASVQDLGYSVNQGAADPYSFSASTPPMVARIEFPLVEEAITGPIGIVDDSGEVTFTFEPTDLMPRP